MFGSKSGRPGGFGGRHGRGGRGEGPEEGAMGGWGDRFAAFGGRHGRGGWGGPDHGGFSPFDERGGGFGGGGFGRGARMGRFFAHGDLHLVVLHLIAEKPRHGYEIIKSIEAMVGGAYSPSPGTIYPALTLLEEQGYVRVEASEGNKKLFSATDEGRAYLAENAAQVEAMLARMAAVGASRADVPPASVLRAVENLKLALRLRLGRGTIDEEAARRISEALDRAVTEIERS